MFSFFLYSLVSVSSFHAACCSYGRISELLIHVPAYVSMRLFLHPAVAHLQHLSSLSQLCLHTFVLHLGLFTHLHGKFGIFIPTHVSFRPLLNPRYEWMFSLRTRLVFNCLSSFYLHGSETKLVFNAGHSFSLFFSGVALICICNAFC